ncbi:hypothetical protein, partial [Sutterella wadsworthensis]|uniref:hypothetical protein n=1 Tax=Sutterella wadsworthensis TaxID=40545 RepID=UPI0030798DD9
MFAHFLAASIVDVNAPSVMADCSKQNVAVRLCRPLIIFRRVKCYQVWHRFLFTLQFTVLLLSKL